MTAPVTPYYLLGRRRLSRVEQQIETALPQCCARWWPVAPAVESVRVSAFAAQDDPLGEAARYCARVDAGWAALFASEREMLQLAQGWLGCAVTRASELIKMLELQFCSELFGALTRCEQVPTVEAAVSWSEFSVAIAPPGSGVIAIEINMAGVAMRWLAAPGLWPALGETPRYEQRPLTDVAAALGASRVHLAARLPAVQMPIAEVANLSAGDFLNLQHDLSGRIQLAGTEMAVSVAAILGRRDDKKAVLITQG